MRPNGAGWALLPLRLFLGGTFVFAGLQKLADPGFFDAAKTGSIQYQIHAYAPSSPLHPLLDLAAHVPVLVGVLIALGEVAAGVGAITGLWTRVAAAGGMAISLLLFLTVSYQVAPFYLGSDIVFLFAWTPLALAGAGGAWSLDEALRRRREPAPASGVPAGAAPRPGVAAQGGG
ncbi:MAG: DoxX family protein, partial [Acidimicrobiales bacterium]